MNHSLFCRRGPGFLLSLGYCLCAGPVNSVALDITNTDGRVYRNAAILSSIPSGVLITYTERGQACGANIPFSKLPPDIRRQFNATPDPSQNGGKGNDPEPHRRAAPGPSSPAVGAGPGEAAVSGQAPGPASNLPRDSSCRSQHPLYFRLAFGELGKSSMLGVVDESGGSGSGYDTVYLDENLNSDCTDEQPKRFPRQKNPRAGTTGWDPQFSVRGPPGKYGGVNFTLTMSDLERKRTNGSQNIRASSLMWRMNLGEWTYLLINGMIKLYPSAAAALEGAPILLGGPCAVEVGAQVAQGRVSVTAAAKDENNCRVRMVYRNNQPLTPLLTLNQGGRVVKKDKMEFG